jgi:hypothetical protein
MASTTHVRNWKVLCWNVRGINSDTKWDCIRDKISESGCDIVCLQETKKEFFDIQFIKKFVPQHLIALNIFLPLELQGGSLQSENHISSLVILCSAMNLESLWNSLQILMLVSEF